MRSSDLGLPAGCAVGTLAWNNHRHVEIYYARIGQRPGSSIPAIRVCISSNWSTSSITPRTGRSFSIATFAPLIAKIVGRCPERRALDLHERCGQTCRHTGIAGHVYCYEDLIAPHSTEFAWPQFDERASAALCYTSGTTGNPKGALYSHRSIVLNSMTICMPGVLGLSSRDACCRWCRCSTSMAGVCPMAA